MIVMTSLVDMYSKCICIKESCQVFDEMTEKDVRAMNTMVSGFFRCGLTMEAMGLFRNMSNRDIWSWNSLISGLARNSRCAGALVLFREIKEEGVKGIFFTMVSVLSVCADLAALVNGKQVHGIMIKHGFGMYRPIGNATLNMYAKCGCMD
ncbi:hypothetical protein GIB67_008074 [Kingdonia uniflora]|uniref:Pentatricopeptide repeat-containing protein n=1 Tax=Kingdonia uniflora TaxID=39325 RepID=A0A7J7MCP9_9MAGN|nr:hypothetical protein GIB67_008074 [Kingdonia uniflora]